jgi:hypothetical protein
VFKDGHRELSTLKHEMVHVCQYDKLGTKGFAHEYADQYVESNYSYDNMAFENDAEAFVGTNQHISTFLGAGNTRGALYAACKD